MTWQSFVSKFTLQKDKKQSSLPSHNGLMLAKGRLELGILRPDSDQGPDSI